MSSDMPPGWYDDPDKPGSRRYWNGSSWATTIGPRDDDTHAAGPRPFTPRGINWKQQVDLKTSVAALVVLGIALYGVVMFASGSFGSARTVSGASTPSAPFSGTPASEVSLLEASPVSISISEPTAVDFAFTVVNNDAVSHLWICTATLRASDTTTVGSGSVTAIRPLGAGAADHATAHITIPSGAGPSIVLTRSVIACR